MRAPTISILFIPQRHVVCQKVKPTGAKLSQGGSTAKLGEVDHRDIRYARIGDIPICEILCCNIGDREAGRMWPLDRSQLQHAMNSDEQAQSSYRPQLPFFSNHYTHEIIISNYLGDCSYSQGSFE